MPRKISVTLESKGSIDRMYLFVDGKKVIAATGGKKTFEGNILDNDSLLKVRVTGQQNASLDVSFECKGTATGKFTLSMDNGYQDLSVTV